MARLNQYYRRALITGASSGLGFAFAKFRGDSLKLLPHGGVVNVEIAETGASVLMLEGAPEITVQKITLGRQDLIEGSVADEIAAILPYEDYVSAETVLALRQTGGERTAIFKSAAVSTEQVAKLRRAQAEAEIVCF